MNRLAFLLTIFICIQYRSCRDEEKIMKACYWPNEQYEPCFGGCAEVSCDNPRNHLRPCYPYCEPGCVCEEPYVRDDRTHQCVLPQDCSPGLIAQQLTSSGRRAASRVGALNANEQARAGLDETQMGIPVPAKRSEKAPSPATMAKYAAGRMSRSHNKRDDMPLDFPENEMPSNNIMAPSNNIMSPNNNPIGTNQQKDDFKRGSEVSRMGNYFNIVIAPPPIKALQPRKLLQNDAYRTAAKRIN